MEGQSEASANMPKVITYHCLCSQLLLATTKLIDSCAQRGRESLDKAYIVRCAPIQTTLSRKSHEDNSLDQTNVAKASDDHVVEAGILHTVLDKRPTLVQRADGYEPRYQRRCDRCELVIGYHLDLQQYNEIEKPGPNHEILYLIPGALVSTASLSAGP